MKKALADALLAAKRHYKSLLLLLGALAVAGVGFFDTYPTYLAKHVTLSESECYQVATLVAVYVFKRDNPNEPIPAGVDEELAKVTRLAKRVAKYVIERSNIPEGIPAGQVYLGIAAGCLGAGGEAELK